MRIRKSIFIAMAVFMVTFSVHLFGQDQNTKAGLSIMCIGDSITEGGKSFQIYRQLLSEKLKRQFDIEFVGSKGTGLKHEGYGGKNSAFLAKTVPANFAKHPASAILIHAGHNNFAKDKPVPGIIENTRKLIEGCRTTNPSVTVLLGQVITSKKLPKYSYIPELNLKLAELAKSLNTEKSPVIVVDHATGFNPDTMTVADKVHPNAKGAEHMAKCWARAIRKALSK